MDRTEPPDLGLQDPIAVFAAKKGIICVGTPTAEGWLFSAYDHGDYVKDKTRPPRFGMKGDCYYAAELAIREIVAEMPDAKIT